jgi:hypothetical protein
VRNFGGQRALLQLPLLHFIQVNFCSAEDVGRLNGLGRLERATLRPDIEIVEYFGTGEKFGVRLQYSYDGDKPLGTGGALKQAAPLLDDSFAVLYGDSYLPFDVRRAVDFFQKFQKQGLMVVYKNRNVIEPSNIDKNRHEITTADMPSFLSVLSNL